VLQFEGVVVACWFAAGTVAGEASDGDLVSFYLTLETWLWTRSCRDFWSGGLDWRWCSSRVDGVCQWWSKTLT
jgi:hypothetical protein